MATSIPIPDQVIEDAARYQEKVLAKISSRPNYTGLSSSTRFEVGYICEYAMRQWFDRHGVTYRSLSNDQGVPDPGDFAVRWGTRELKVDVKGSDHPRAAYLMVPVAQWERRVRHYDVLVGAHYKRILGIVDLIGTCGVDRFPQVAERADVRVPTYRVPFSELRPIELLLGSRPALESSGA